MDTDNEREQRGRMSARTYKRLVAALLLLMPLLLAGVVVIIVLSLPVSEGTQLRLDAFEQMIGTSKLQSTILYNRDARIVGDSSSGRFWVALPGDNPIATAAILNALTSAKVPTVVDDQPVKGAIAPLLLVVPTMFIADILLLIYLGSQRPTLEGSEYARAGAGQMSRGGGTVSFTDVAGAEEPLAELREVRDFLSSPDRFLAVGARVPRGILLQGPPGCGKTLLARAVAGEASVPFFWISGSQFVEMYVGVGAARIRDLFRDARAAAPSIIFIDEIDAVGRLRGSAAVGAASGGERESTLNQLLVEMDGFDPRTAVVVLAASNRADVLDPALLRPGRFDRLVNVEVPDVRGRLAILRTHARGKPMAHGIDLQIIARRTPGFTGADLANLMNEAALLAVRQSRREITQADVEGAVDRIMVGTERHSRVLTDADKRVVAFHEAGHAVASHILLPDAAVFKVSVVARTHSLGRTVLLPDEESQILSERGLRDRIAAALSGRIAEEMMLGQASAGAHQDLDFATRIARRMVFELGMSPMIGLRSLAIDSVDLANGEIVRPYSEDLAATADREIQRILEEGRSRAVEVLGQQRRSLEVIADALIREESLDGNAIAAAMRPAVALEPA